MSDLSKGRVGDRDWMMRVLRVLALFLIGCGLFVQSSAYAVARPTTPVSMELHCQEMMMGKTENAASGDEEGPCREMRLDCLVVMNCIAPLFASNETPTVRPAAAERRTYAPLRAAVWLNSSRGPEPPPPQTRL